MTDIYLIRHAESEANVNCSHLITGRSNHYPLTQNGVLQTEKLAYRLQKEDIRFDRLIASPAVRTQDTGRIVRDIIAPGQVITTDDRIQELDQGLWQGTERRVNYTPDMLKTINADNWNFKPPQGESQREVENRMFEFMQCWADMEPNGKIAVFTHGIAIKCLLRKIMDFAPPTTIRLDIDNTSLTVLQHGKNGWHPNRINDHAHLAI